jgi:transcriptional regulator with XRE-family HTH domain
LKIWKIEPSAKPAANNMAVLMASPVPSNPTVPARPLEGIAAKLARNLVAARVAAGVTQQQLADRAEVSRATIAQIEAGVSDPKFSTILQLAHALNVDALLLLLGTNEVETLASLLELDLDTPHYHQLRTSDLREIQRLVGSGMLRDRLNAAKLGAAAAQAVGYATQGSIGAAIGAAIRPGIGTVIGAALAQLLSGEPAGQNMSKSVEPTPKGLPPSLNSPRPAN